MTHRWTGLALLCVASFMVILDAQIVTIAVPAIERELGFSTGGVQWVLTAYIVTFGGLLLAGGRAADLFGRRRVFMVGVAMFSAASLLCGFSGSPEMLIGARIWQGLAAAVMSPAALSILLNLFPDGPERNTAIGIWSGVAGVGGTAGALVGGPLTDGLGWEWIFFINVPAGGVLLLLALVLLPTGQRSTARSLDAAGGITITGALVLLVYGVSRAPESGWYGGQTLGVLAAGVALLATFVLIERRSAAPLVPLDIFSSRTVVGGNLVGLAAGMGAFAQAFLLTQYAQQVLGWSAVRFGVATAVLPFLAVVGSVLGPRLVAVVGVRPVVAVSAGSMFVGFLWWTQLPADGGYAADLLPGLLIFGPGLGACCVAAAIAAVTGVPADRSGLASGLNNATFQIGAALGIALVATATVSRDPLLDGLHAGFAVALGFPAAALLAATVLLAPISRRTEARCRPVSEPV